MTDSQKLDLKRMNSTKRRFAYMWLFSLPFSSTSLFSSRLKCTSYLENMDSFSMPTRSAWAQRTTVTVNYEIEKLEWAPCPVTRHSSTSCQALISLFGWELRTPCLCFPSTPHPIQPPMPKCWFKKAQLQASFLSNSDQPRGPSHSI